MYLTSNDNLYSVQQSLDHYNEDFSLILGKKSSLVWENQNEVKFFNYLFAQLKELFCSNFL